MMILFFAALAGGIGLAIYSLIGYDPDRPSK